MTSPAEERPRDPIDEANALGFREGYRLGWAAALASVTDDERLDVAIESALERPPSLDEVHAYFLADGPAFNELQMRLDRIRTLVAERLRR